jgi:hypothetical protein
MVGNSRVNLRLEGEGGGAKALAPSAKPSVLQLP